MRFSEKNFYPNEIKLQELKDTFQDIFSNLSMSIKNKKDLYDVIKNDNRVLKSEDIVQNQKPEDFTKRVIIRPLLKVLNFETQDIGRESGQKLASSTRWADYTLTIDKELVLIEAEPINKDLYAKKSGVEQVREWILSKKTKTDFGIATDGFKWIMVKFDANSLKMKELNTINLRPIFLEFVNQSLLEVKTEDILNEFYSCLSKESITSAFKEISFELEGIQEEISQNFYSQYMDYVFGIDSKTGS